MALNPPCEFRIEHVYTCSFFLFLIVEVFNIGDIYFSKRKYDDSRKYLSKVIEIEEEDDATINNIGICLKGVGNLNGALEHYKKAREINGINRLYSKNIEKLEEKISKNNLVYKD